MGLLTTQGFRDVLDIGRVRMPDLFDLTWEKPVPLVERRLRLEVDERVAADGSIVRPLDQASLVAAAGRLVDHGVEAIAVCFINSYVNAAHEEEAARVLRARYPALDITTSCGVLPEIKEYERTSTTVVNAYLLPVMRRYLDDLSGGLRRIGLEAPLLVVASNGGVVGAAAAAERPVFAVGSGPAAGVSGAARLGRAMGEPNLIVFDMGGTTAKASLVEEGRVTLTTEYEFRDGISTSSRFIKAGGYMLKVPPIDIAEVGAGAGSIAWIPVLHQVVHVPLGALRAAPGRAQQCGRLPVHRRDRARGHHPEPVYDEATLQLRSDRMRFLPYGLAGGKPARGTRNVLNPDTEARVMPAKFAVTLKRGDVILHEQPGGGFGDPFTRDPERVAVDVQNEKISLAYARREHGVVIDPVALTADLAATRALRAPRATDPPEAAAEGLPRMT